MVVEMTDSVFAEYDHGSLIRIFRIMQSPVMPHIPAHDCYIILIHIENLEIHWIQIFEIIRIKHDQFPSRQTTHPELS